MSWRISYGDKKENEGEIDRKNSEEIDIRRKGRGER